MTITDKIKRRLADMEADYPFPNIYIEYVLLTEALKEIEILTGVRVEIEWVEEP